ncbi:MAG: beta-propeller domain-containing protein [Oscillospiraceae bacterium]|nr:beta-propeller domain-containing protein [Oscillospiraceae bacterium]
MKFEDKLNELISEAEVPDELSPHNIAKMLKAQNARSKMESEHRTSKSGPNISVLRRTIIIRTVAAAAACAVFVFGMTAYNANRAEQEKLEEQITFKALPPVSYDEYGDLYTTYTGIDLNGSNSSADSDKPIEETTIPDDTDEPIVKAPDKSFSELSSYDFTDKDKYGENVSEADVIKTDGEYIYCLKGSTLTIISLETMEIVSTVESSLDPPVEIYKDGDKVFLISGDTEEIQIIDSSTASAVTESSQAETSSNTSNVPANDVNLSNSASGNSDIETVPNDETRLGEYKSPALKTATRTNTLVDIYDVSDAANPIHTTSYKQNGSYIASWLVDSTLYMVTDYNSYRIKPLDTQTDLDSFVPAYYINGEKFYLAANDIIVPSNAGSTDYTVAAAIITDGSSNIKANVKAVLGGGRNIYCSADTLYIASAKKSENGNYSIISSFDLAMNGISYVSGGIVDGEILGRQSMNEYDGKLRVAARLTDENGIPSTAIYVLDKSMTVENSAGQILHSESIATVRFEKNYARLFRKNSPTAAAVIDLSSNPPTFAQTAMDSAVFLYKYSDDKLLGIGTSAESGITLSMFGSESGLTIGSTTFAPGETFSKALTDRRAVLIDSAAGVIGIPVYSHNEFGTKNQYYVYGFDEGTGFFQKGVIEYTDIDDSMIFERGEIIGDNLYVISSGRVISARLSDLKIIETYEF